MKYSNIIGTTAITLAMGLAAPLAIADMHGDMDDMGDKTHTNGMDGMDGMGDKSDMNKEKMHDDARDQSADQSELGDRSETTGVGIESRPGSTGMDRAVPGEPDVGLEPETEPGY